MIPSSSLRVAVLGASGYTGAELLRLLYQHPHVEVVALSGESQAGQPIGTVFPHLAPAYSHQLVCVKDIDFSACDVVMCCLPHATTQPILASLPTHLRIIDLSADFRLHDLAAYARWYGHEHQAPSLQKEAVYGLSEHHRTSITTARLVANPGCYPTCSLLPLLPLLEADLIEANGIIIDAMSGVSGAGRKAQTPMLFSEANESVRAYGVGGHRHVAEIEQEVSRVVGRQVQVSFTAHLVPMTRGMSATLHVATREGASAADMRDALRHRYADAPFVQICEAGVIPSTREVIGTNHCRISVTEDRLSGHAIVVSVIDNLVKGASGQAVQNLNLMMGWDEDLALRALAVCP